MALEPQVRRDRLDGSLDIGDRLTKCWEFYLAEDKERWLPTGSAATFTLCKRKQLGVCFYVP